MNYLFVYFILGFPHSAFSFGVESNSVQSNIDGVSIPSGALISVLQKGVQFVEAEACFGEVNLLNICFIIKTPENVILSYYFDSTEFSTGHV